MHGHRKREDSVQVWVAQGEAAFENTANPHFSFWIDCTRVGRSLLDPVLSPSPSRPYLQRSGGTRDRTRSGRCAAANGAPWIAEQAVQARQDRRSAEAQLQGTHSPRPHTYTSAAGHTFLRFAAAIIGRATCMQQGLQSSSCHVLLRTVTILCDSISYPDSASHSKTLTAAEGERQRVPAAGADVGDGGVLQPRHLDGRRGV